MALDTDVFEEALGLFHQYSLQNNETVSKLHLKGLLPETKRPGFSVLDIGAGQGHLPSLMRDYTDNLVVLEPNPRCVAALKQQFERVYPYRWEPFACKKIQQDFPEGFHLITMSHMLYHFKGLEDIQNKIKLAVSLLKPEGSLVIVLNKSSALMARIGISYQFAEGRLDEALVNQEIHQACHSKQFYEVISENLFPIEIETIETPLCNVPSRKDLVGLLRMCLINPLSQAPCQTEKIDTFISQYLDKTYTSLTFPATLASEDELIVLRRALAYSLSKTS